jgi:hypothetical protein
MRARHRRRPLFVAAVGAIGVLYVIAAMMLVFAIVVALALVLSGTVGR